MNKFAKRLKTKLWNIIDEMEKNRYLFVKKGDKDFSRKRKLNFSTIVYGRKHTKQGNSGLF